MAKYVRVFSWNINGVKDPVKSRKCLCYLKSQQTDVAFIQETHLVDSEVVKLKRDWVGQVFYSSFNSKKRGVAILVHKKLNFVLLKQIKMRKGGLFV